MKWGTTTATDHILRYRGNKSTFSYNIMIFLYFFGAPASLVALCVSTAVLLKTYGIAPNMMKNTRELKTSLFTAI